MFVLGARLWTLAVFGSDVPFLDQWDGEARAVYEPYLAGGLGMDNLVSAHNEHRIFLTRMIDLALLKINGRWDPRVEAVVGNGIYALLAGSLVIWVGEGLGRQFRAAFALVTVVLFSLPFGYENTLGGFQIQLFLLLFISHLTIWLIVGGRMELMGLVVAVLGLGTMASGFLASAACIPVLLWKVWSAGARPTLRVGLVVTCLLALVGLGLYFRVTVPENVALGAHSVGQFIKAFLRYASWPMSAALWPALIYGLPWFTLLYFNLGRRTPPTQVTLWIGAGGIWCLLQMLAIAYGRGGEGGPVPRYADILAQWLLVNFAGICQLQKEYQERCGAKRFWSGGVLWVLLVTVGLVTVTKKELETRLIAWKNDFAEFTVNLSGYVNTGEAHHLEGKIPHPDRAMLKRLLDSRELRNILPPGIAPRVPLVTAAGDFSLTLPSPLTFPSGGGGVSLFPHRDARAEWRSEVITASDGSYLRFEVAGEGRGGEITLQNAKTGALVGRLSLQAVVPNKWTTVDVLRPEHPYYVRVSEFEGGGWVALSAPVPVGILSVWLIPVLRFGPWILLAGGGVLAWFATRKDQEKAGEPVVTF